MIRKLRKVILVLICIFAVLTIYLAIIKPIVKKDSIIMDSFTFSTKEHDTLSTNYPIQKEEIKGILFTINCFSNEYGGGGISIGSIYDGETFFHRRFKVNDSTLIYGKQKINVGDIYEDIIQYKSIRNIFKIHRNKLSIKNEGYIKVIKVFDFSPDQQTIKLEDPILLISGKSQDSFYVSKPVTTFYRTTPYILVLLGLSYLLLSLIIKTKFK